ncbi:chitinase [Multifurca ochricompacta]|uniref:Chitinase n=1 Tax=Multifurca ochricompacta TaxID=376703 RepID=A0AAD4QP40_9AGAM|nr:chitinase [Multifurca ochricompacta]
MKTLLALYFILYTQLSQAAPSCLSPISARSSGVSGRSSVSSPPVAVTWYGAWHSDEFTLQDVNWSKYTSVMYAFATTTPDVNTIGLSSSDESLLPQFVATAKHNHVNAILSIGGWTGSRYFSSAVATQANRTAFAQAIMRVISRYNLNGIEFDWEHPNKQGIGCNFISADDSTNFLTFLQTLRNQKGAKNLILSAAVAITPFVGPDGSPLSDVSGFAKVLNYIDVMNYDVWGSWEPSVGPNAPLDDSCAPSPQGSAKSAVKAWTNAGFPANQIILGVPAYGSSYRVDPKDAYDTSGKLKPYVPFDRSKQPAGDKWDSTAGGVDVCGNPNVVGGVFNFWGLIDGGFLTEKGTPAKGIDYTFDQCSQTPFIYNPKSHVMVSYDDASSFAAKGHYIRDAGLAGFSMWQAGGDSRSNILLNAISSAAGAIR